MELTLEPIGYVRAARQAPADDTWGGSAATIELADDVPAEALAGLDAFSHAEIIFAFHQVDPVKIVRGARHPRNNQDWPKVGIFAQRGKNRPNRLGLTTVRILAVEGRALRVAELDAIDGTPVLDIKPVMAEFLPRGPVRQPEWASALMRDYWRTPDGGPRRDELRHSFGPIAALYDAARPGYPPAVVDLALAQTAAAAPRMVEVGCGSGQASESFARLGFPMLLSDPSPALLDLARRRLAAYPNVTFLEGSFEDLALPDSGFDLLIAAQSFHWVDLERGLAQARRLLAPGGGMALFWNFIDYDADPLLADLRDTCVAHAPAFAGWPDAGAAPLAQFRGHWRTALGAAPGFAAPDEQILASTLGLTRAQLLQLIASFSWAQALAPAARAALLADLEARLRPAREPIGLPLRTLVVTARRERA